MERERYLLVTWPDSRPFADGKLPVYPAGGDSSFFVAKGHFEGATGRPVPAGRTIFVAVPFPESQDFSDVSQFESHPIVGMAGLERYGPGALFVEEGAYREVRRMDGHAAANLMDIFLREAYADDCDTGPSSLCLKQYYEGANQVQRTAVNEVFVALCGRSFEDLLEMEQEAGGGGPPPAP